MGMKRVALERRSCVRLGLCLWLGLAELGCNHPRTTGPGGGSGAAGSGGASAGGASGAAGAGEGGCGSAGAGDIDLHITGLPQGLDAGLILRGPRGAQAIFESTALAGIDAGTYLLELQRVGDADPSVRTLYEPTASATEFCLAHGASHTVEVSYEAVPTSHHLWTTSWNGSAALLGFSAADLRATSSPEPRLAAALGTGKDVTFDAEGNLWSMGASAGPPHLLRFSRDGLLGAEAPAPDRSIDISGVQCVPEMRAFAFDRQGALWVSTCGGRVVRLNAADLTASGQLEGALGVDGLSDNEDLAFDILQNLWMVDADAVIRFDASRLTEPVTSAPDLALTIGGGDAGAVIPRALAFDAGGNLWVTDFDAARLVRIAHADLQGTGLREVSPEVSLTLNSEAPLERPAFDESGGLWLALDSDRLGRLAPGQLTSSSGALDPITPEIVITSPNVGTASRMALYPAPAGLPLHHSVP